MPLEKAGSPAAVMAPELPENDGFGGPIFSQATKSPHTVQANRAPDLRPYQTDVIHRINEQIAAGNRRILMVTPTGSGKTVVAGAIIREWHDRGKRVIVFAHRRELVRQTSEKLYAVGVDHGILQAGFPSRPSERVQVASVQTIHARAIRSRQMEIPSADLVVIDECHHARANTYRDLVACYPEAVIIGMTATPCRGDGRGLGTIFDTMVECPSVAELIEQKHLVGTRVYAPSTPDLHGVKVERGDYAEKQLAERMDKPELIGDIVEHWHRLAERRKTVIFATGVSHSVHLRNEFRKSGVLAEHVDGGTPIEERDAILARLKRGEIDLVTNCMVLCEGWDQPEVGCLVLARPTRSIGLFRQMIGRVLRPYPGKEFALILDHAGATFEHGFAEDPITWTLSEDKRAENKVHRQRASGRGMPSLTTCPECMGIRFEGRGCTICGWKPQPKPEDFRTADGVLTAVSRDRAAADIPESMKMRFHGMLCWIAREKGYKSGWASHKYREKFGHWPQCQLTTPVEPDDACSRWVRSRQIAYAKSQQKKAAVS